MNIRPDQPVAALRSDLSGSNEQSYIVPTEMGGTAVSLAVTLASTAGSAQGDYFFAQGVAAFWLDIDEDGTEPTGANYVSAAVKIKCGIATGDTAEQVAQKVYDAIILDGTLAAIVGFEVNGAVVTSTNFTRAETAGSSVHNAGDTGDGSMSLEVLAVGAAPDVQGKFFSFSSTDTNYYAWFSSGGNGTDPEVADRTGVEIALDGDESNSEYLAAIVSALDGTTGMTASLDQNRIVLKVDAIGNATDLEAGDSGFSVAVQGQGTETYYSPSLNLAAQSNVPSIIE